MRTRTFCIALALAGEMLASRAHAGLTTWTGNGADSNWHTAANWNGSDIPDPDDTVVFATGFGSGDALHLDSSVVVSSLLINAPTEFFLHANDGSGGYHRISLVTGNVTRTATAAGLHSWQVDVGMGNSGTWNIGGSDWFGVRAISQTSPGMSLTKTGTGRLSIGQATQYSPYSGGTTVSAGELMAGTNALGSGAVVVQSGATLMVGGYLDNAVSLVGNGYNGQGAFNSPYGGTLKGPVTLTNNAAVGTGIIEGVIDDGPGPYTLTKVGTGTLTLTNANTFDGNLVISDGIVELRHHQAGGLANIVLANGNATVRLNGLTQPMANEIANVGSGQQVNGVYRGGINVVDATQATVNGAVVLTDFSVINVGEDAQLTLNGAVVRPSPNHDADLTKEGDGTMVLINAGNDMDILRIRDGMVIGTNSAAVAKVRTSVHDGATFAFEGGLTYAHPNGAEIRGDGHQDTGALRSRTGINTYNTSLHLLSDAAIGVDAGSTLMVLGDITHDPAQTYSLRKVGGGLLLLGGNSLFKGDFDIAAGDVSIAGDAQLGANVNNAVTAGSGARLLVRESTATTRNFSFTDAAIDVAAGKILTYNTASVQGATLSGNGRHDLANGTTLFMSHVATGATVVQTGNVTATTITNKGVIRNEGGTLVWDQGNNGGELHVNTLTNAAGFRNEGLLHVNDGGTFTHFGDEVISTDGSKLVIDKNALLTTNGYALQLNGAHLTNNGTLDAKLQVNAGATAMGSGTFGDVAVNNGGVFAPGNSPGTAMTGDVVLAAGGHYQWEINNAAGAPGSALDLWLADEVVIGVDNVPGNTFTIDIVTLLPNHTAGAMSNFDPEASYAWTILTANSITGFDPAYFTLDTTGVANPLEHKFVLDQIGHSLVLTYNAQSMPEPASAVLVLLGTLLIHHRRK